MSLARKIVKLSRSEPVIEGAGVHLKRAFGDAEVELFDPFLMLDDFRSDTPTHFLNGFPWHPHRGIETITYVLEGDIEHGDSLGHEGIIGSGDVQWMTAGSGIIHQEMPKGSDEGKMHGFQLWANLPASHKMIDPAYRDVTSKDIPTVTHEDGTNVKVICGSFEGVNGPVHNIVTDPEYLDVAVAPNSEFTHSTKRDHTLIAYVIAGQGRFSREDDRAIDNTSLILFSEGNELVVVTDDEPVRFLLMSGKPIGEPIAWRGPIVMNTREEIRIAYEELNNGTFIKHG